jgi:CBS domain-containing protein
MDKESIKGAGQKIKGKIEEVVGKILGDKKLELHGKPDQLEGDVARILAAKGRDVVRTEQHRTLAEAVEILMARNIGAIVVVDAYGSYGHVLGILWERDIVHAIAKDGGAALNDAVSKYMATPVVTAHEDDSLNMVMEKMTVGRCRHLPVVADEKLIGIVSIGDVVKYKLDQLEHEHQALCEYIETA